MRRASTSIPANIAEGCGIGSDRAFSRHLRIAMGSACELEYYLVLANELGLLKKADHDALAPQVSEVKRMLATLIKRLRVNG